MTERKLRIGSKLQAAITAMVEGALTRADAAKHAGITDHALYCALRKPHVAAFRTELMRVFRESEASRTIKRVADLADTANSEHVRLDASKWLGEIEGIQPIARGEVVH